MPHNHESVQIRIGIHIGSLASGLVGPKMPKFTLFGDTMNTASRMESTCKPGRIQVSAAFAGLLPGEEWQDTGGVEIKGKVRGGHWVVEGARRGEVVARAARRMRARSSQLVQQRGHRRRFCLGIYLGPAVVATPPHV